MQSQGEARRWIDRGARWFALAVAAATSVGSIADCLAAEWPAPTPLDTARLEAVGLRVVASPRCELLTDLPSRSDIDELPTVIDRATPLWEERFGVEAGEWRVRACLIRDEAKFRAAGLMPLRREFEHGLAVGARVWLREQPSPYFRRALLLHEATHSFMMMRLGGCGPGWFMEGVAELCGAHVWDQQRLRVAVVPADRRSAPEWGRVKLLQESRHRSIRAVQSIDNRAALPAVDYAWAWGLAAFLDAHPRYQERFRALANDTRDEHFDDRFWEALGPDERRLSQEWRLFTETVCYGHELDREAIQFVDGEPIDLRHTVRVAADRGWQSSGVLVEPGRVYRMRASGRFVIGRERDGRPWDCEPDGVTLAYHRGEPLGRLLAAVDRGVDAFVRPVAIGAAAEFVPERAGTLYLRVNDSPNGSSDNAGTISVEVAVD